MFALFLKCLEHYRTHRDIEFVPVISIFLINIILPHRGEIPDMNNILDRDDVTIMKRAIFSTQVMKKRVTHTPKIVKINLDQYFNLLEWASLGNI